jgi:hypothetical protein
MIRASSVRERTPSRANMRGQRSGQLGEGGRVATGQVDQGGGHVVGQAGRVPVQQSPCGGRVQRFQQPGGQAGGRVPGGHGGQHGDRITAGPPGGERDGSPGRPVEQVGVVEQDQHRVLPGGGAEQLEQGQAERQPPAGRVAARDRGAQRGRHREPVQQGAGETVQTGVRQIGLVGVTRGRQHGPAGHGVPGHPHQRALAAARRPGQHQTSGNKLHC